MDVGFPWVELPSDLCTKCVCEVVLPDCIKKTTEDTLVPVLWEKRAGLW